MNSLVSFALRQRWLIVALLASVLLAGGVSFWSLNIEAYPDPVPPMVDIVTQSTGQSAEEIERYITIPIEIQMTGIPHVTAIRTISLFGLSDVKVQFNYDFTHEQAEQWVINRLSQLSPLPNNAIPTISPESPIGEIYRYQLVGPPGYSVTDLKTLQDWVLERRFKAVPGVIDVSGWGGKTKTFEVAIDSQRLANYGVSMGQVIQAINNSDLNVGGQTINIGPQSAVVRGIGLIHSLDQIRDIAVAAPNGRSIFIKDLATVEVSNLPRLGIAGRDQQDDIVQGIVLMRRGAESSKTIAAVVAEAQKINSLNILPPGVHLDHIYDRSELISTTTHTVVHNMLSGMLLIFLLQWAFLGNLRTAIIVGMTIPFALSFALIIMVLKGESANLLSVGAVDFGLIVDATVIMMENIFRHLAEQGSPHSALPSRLEYIRTPAGFSGKFKTMVMAASEVSQPIFFAAAIIFAGFVPLFTLSGIEGHIFSPMAKTYGYAIVGGLLAAFTVTPALSALLMPAKVEETETWIVEKIRQAYRPVIEAVLRHQRATLIGAGVAAMVVFLVSRTLGLEFLPKLEEGNLWIRATFPPSISLEESNHYVNGMRKLLATYPEVQSVVSQHGRPDDGTDATGFFNAEFFVPLKPEGDWPRGVSKATLTAELTQKLNAQYPGVDFNFSQYIEDNVEEAASGVKGENSIKVVGNDLKTLERLADQIEKTMSTVPGITDLSVFRSLGQPALRIDIDRVKAARYGLAPGDVNAVVQSAIGGQATSDVYEENSDRHFPIIVRLKLNDRNNVESIKHIPIQAPDPTGNGRIVQIPLMEVAHIYLDSGASFIYREQQERYVPIKFSVRGRDLGGSVLEAKSRIASEVQLPPGYRLEWTGEFGNLQDALSRLAIVVPLSILLIGFLLYVNFGRLRDVVLAASVIPMAMIGGLLALLMTQTSFSVSAAIGFVALFGLASMDGILVLSYFNLSLEQGLDRLDAIRATCRTRLRQAIMTSIAACLGLLPAAISTGIGSQVQRPLAIVVVGGMLLAPILSLLVLPVLILRFSDRQPESQLEDGDGGRVVAGMKLHE